MNLALALFQAAFALVTADLLVGWLWPWDYFGRPRNEQRRRT